MEPVWTRSLSEVLKHNTKSVELVSERTGKTYTTDIIEKLGVYAIGAPEALEDGKYRYSVIDRDNNLEYKIKAPNKVNSKFGDVLVVLNLRGGALNNGKGWYSADKVLVYDENQVKR